MRYTFFGLLVILIGVSQGGCSTDGERAEVERKYQLLLETVRTNDEVALYEMARPEFRIQFDGLAKRIGAVIDAASDGKLSVGEETIRRALALGPNQLPGDGLELFREWVNLGDLSLGPGREVGLSPAGVSQRGEYSLLVTANEESFGFHRGQDGAWYTLLPERAYELWEARDRVLANLEQLENTLATADGEG